MKKNFQNFFDNIREKVVISDIVGAKVTLVKKGYEYSGLCPFHSEKTPSFTVNNAKRFYHCFGCGAHGDVIKFVTETYGVAYKDAAIKIAEDNNIPIPKFTAEQEALEYETNLILNALSKAADFFHSSLNEESKIYLRKRLISENDLKDYQIGFADMSLGIIRYLESHQIPLKIMYDAGLIGKRDNGEIYTIFKNRIMFPIKNAYGKTIGFGGRALKDIQPKYLNSPETSLFNKSEVLYGEDKATGEAYRQKRVIVVEGYVDVISMHKAGFVETVAALGTAITQSHFNKLSRIADEIIFCMDGDNAGLKSMQKAIRTIMPIMKESTIVYFIVLPYGLDPDSVILQFGASYMQKLLDQKMTLSEMLWYLETNGKTFSTPESKAFLENTLEQYIALSSNKILDKYLRSDFKNKIWNLSHHKHKHNQSIIDDAVYKIVNMPSASEIVIYNIIFLIVEHNIILSDGMIYSQFLELNIQNEDLSALRDSILKYYDIEKQFNVTDFIKTIQNSSFLNIFDLVYSSCAPFIDVNTIQNTKSPYNLWDFFNKKYEYELLKAEYNALEQKAKDINFEKIKFYNSHIVKLEKEIKDMIENNLL